LLCLRQVDTPAAIVWPGGFPDHSTRAAKISPTHPGVGEWAKVTEWPYAMIKKSPAVRTIDGSTANGSAIANIFATATAAPTDEPSAS
jgi:hypothetical protein